MSLFEELKRRNVFKVGGAYVIIAWLLMQVADTFAPALHLPEWFTSAIAFVLILGIPLALFFAWAYELTPEGIKKEKDVDRTGSITQVTGRKLDFIIIALLVISLGYFIWESRFADAPIESTSIRANAETHPEVKETDGQDIDLTPVKTIAVLPFVNMSSEPDQEYFSDGISEELLNVLAQFPGLRVAARTSAFQFKGQNLDIAVIANQLHVNHILEGSVRKAGNRVRITAQLIEADSGFHLWSESYDRELDDIFAIQDEISAAIGDALKIELQLAAGESQPTVPTTASAQAYEYYLKGRQLINGRSSQGIAEAVLVLEKALELDESYAPAHAQLAIAIILLNRGGGSYGNLSREEVLARAIPHIDRAFALDPDLAEAFGAKALLYSLNYEWAKALENSVKALERNPSYVDVLNWQYLVLMNSGQWTKATKTMHHMMAVDPMSIVGRVNYAFLLARTDRIAQALKVADGLGRESSHISFVVHGLISADYLGTLSESNEWYLKALALDPGDTFSRHRLAVNFVAIRAFDEARSIAPEYSWWVNAREQRWSEAIAQARQRVIDSPGDNVASMQLANVLHMSGDLAGAQEIYENLLLVTGEYAILDPSNTTVMPTARAAFGRLAAGNAAGAEVILEIVRSDLRLREAAGINKSYKLRAAAMVAAMEGDREMVMAHIDAAIEAGLRHSFIFREPAMEPYWDDPDFQALAARLNEIQEEERSKTLQLICFDNPAAEVWQPLPETCQDVRKYSIVDEFRSPFAENRLSFVRTQNRR